MDICALGVDTSFFSAVPRGKHFPSNAAKAGFPGPEFIKSPAAAKMRHHSCNLSCFWEKQKKLAGTAFPPSPPMDSFAICSYPGWRRSCSPRSSRIYTFSFHGAPRRKIPRPQPEAPECFAGSYSHTHPKIRPTQRTRNATPQAMAHWVTTVTAAARALPISRLTVAMAATQGV